MGGPQIDQTLKELGVVSERLEGLRVTDDRTMKVVEMVLGGQVNQEIVSLIGNHGGRAVGLTGRDDAFLRATKVAEMRTKSGKLVDPGRVGAIRHVNPDVVTRLVESGFIPVIAPVAVDAEAPMTASARVQRRRAPIRTAPTASARARIPHSSRPPPK